MKIKDEKENEPEKKEYEVWVGHKLVGIATNEEEMMSMITIAQAREKLMRKLSKSRKSSKKLSNSNKSSKKDLNSLEENETLPNNISTNTITE